MTATVTKNAMSSLIGKGLVASVDQPVNPAAFNGSSNGKSLSAFRSPVRITGPSRVPTRATSAVMWAR